MSAHTHKPFAIEERWKMKEKKKKQSLPRGERGDELKTLLDVLKINIRLLNVISSNHSIDSRPFTAVKA